MTFSARRIGFAVFLLALMAVPVSAPAAEQGLVDRIEALEKVLQNALVATLEPCEELGPGWRPSDYGRGRVLIGTGGEGELAGEPGKIGGSAEIEISLEHMPPHTHTVTSMPAARLRELGINLHNGFAGSDNNLGLSPVYNPEIKPVPGWQTTQHDQFMSESGGGEALDHLPPYVLVNLCQLKQ